MDGRGERTGGGGVSTPDRPAGREELTLWTLVRTGHVAGRRFTDVFAAAGLTPAQYGVLACLADGDDLSQAELARAVLVRPQSMHRLVSDMVEAGLVRRDGPGGRGRRSGVSPTPAGLAALAHARPAAYALGRPDRLGLTPEELDQLGGLLARVGDALADEPADRPTAPPDEVAG